MREQFAGPAVVRRQLHCSCRVCGGIDQGSLLCQGNCQVEVRLLTGRIQLRRMTQRLDCLGHLTQRQKGDSQIDHSVRIVGLCSDIPAIRLDGVVEFAKVKAGVSQGAQCGDIVRTRPHDCFEFIGGVGSARQGRKRSSKEEVDVSRAITGRIGNGQEESELVNRFIESTELEQFLANDPAHFGTVLRSNPEMLEGLIPLAGQLQ